MTLQDYLDRYSLQRDVTASTIEHYKWVVRSFERLAGPVELDKLSADHVNLWLAQLKEDGRSPFTIKQRKISLSVLWRAAWEEGLAPPLPPIRRLKPIRHNPQAWTVQEVHQLLAAAEAERRRPRWWTSLIRTAYDTGLRLCDLLSIQVSQVASVMTIMQAKTGFPVTVSLRPETLQTVQRHVVDMRPADLVWKLWGRLEAFYRAFRKLVAAAGIRKGTFRWLRRTAATQVETVQSGAGTALLGHASRSTTETWYLDRSQLSQPPLPPW